MLLQSAKAMLNRPGTRWLLGQLATARARQRGNSTEIFFDDGVWIHRFGERFIADWVPNPHADYAHEIDRRRAWWLSFYYPSPGDVIVDVGTSIGYEALMFADALGGTGRVIAIEAHPQTYACLVKTCEYNGLHNVTPLNIALSEEEGVAFIEDDSAHIGNSIAPEAKKTPASVAVRSRNLDDVCADLGLESLACVRMNIEGAERMAVRGMRKMLPRTATAVIACHDFKADRTGNEFFRTKREVTELLENHGFRIVKLDFDEPWANDHVYAYNPALTRNPMERPSAPPLRQPPKRPRERQLAAAR